MVGGLETVDQEAGSDLEAEEVGSDLQYWGRA